MINIAFFVQIISEHTVSVVKNILRNEDITVFINAEFSEQLSSFARIKVYHSIDDFPKECLYMISIGGDGTFLSATKYAIRYNIPIMGIHAGRLGFLARFDQESSLNFTSLLSQSTIESLSLFDVHTESHPTFHAVNDVCVERIGTAIAEINFFADKIYMATYWADGIIIATPTGSTAYSLSSGGPIIHPKSQCLVVVPIASHNLNSRPIILPNNITLEVTLKSRSQKVQLAIDNSSIEIPNEQKITISPSSKKIQILQPANFEYFTLLRNKLLWGVDRRTYTDL